MSIHQSQIRRDRVQDRFVFCEAVHGGILLTVCAMLSVVTTFQTAMTASLLDFVALSKFPISQLTCTIFMTIVIVLIFDLMGSKNLSLYAST